MLAFQLLLGTVVGGGVIGVGLAGAGFPIFSSNKNSLVWEEEGLLASKEEVIDYLKEIERKSESEKKELIRKAFRGEDWGYGKKGISMFFIAKDKGENEKVYEYDLLNSESVNIDFVKRDSGNREYKFGFGSIGFRSVSYVEMKFKDVYDLIKDIYAAKIKVLQTSSIKDNNFYATSEVGKFSEVETKWSSGSGEKATTEVNFEDFNRARMMIYLFGNRNEIKSGKEYIGVYVLDKLVERIGKEKTETEKNKKWSEIIKSLSHKPSGNKRFRSSNDLENKKIKELVYGIVRGDYEEWGAGLYLIKYNNKRPYTNPSEADIIQKVNLLEKSSNICESDSAKEGCIRITKDFKLAIGFGGNYMVHNEKKFIEWFIPNIGGTSLNHLSLDITKLPQYLSGKASFELG